MIGHLIRFALTQHAITLMLVMGIVAAGLFSVATLRTDSFPDVSNVQVQIITEPESMAAEEVESLVTIPIEYALNGLPFVKKVRSGSEFGLSVVTAIFDDNCDVYLARQLVQQRLTTMHFPEGVPRPQLGPVISSFSQVFMYYVTSDRHNQIDLRTIQDWTIAKRLLSVQGVGNVVTYGGFIKQYQVVVDQFKLRSYGITLHELLEAISRSNTNAGGNFIEAGDEEVIIRGIGRIHNERDLANIVLKEVNGTPVRVRNVAHVEIGPAFRRGSASMNGKGEAIIGIVMTRKGANTKEVVHAVEKKIEKIQRALPDGIKITPFYNQKELVDKTMETVKEILLWSGSLVIIVLAAILMNIRVSLIVALIIPLSLLFSFMLMKFSGLSSNLMTLGAVDFGIVVDAGVVMAENIFRKLSDAWKNTTTGKIDVAGTILNAAQEVGKPICFSILIIISVYIPLFALEGVEGRMFQPLALTFIYALIGALVVSLFMIPVFCFWFLRRPIQEKHNPVIESIKRQYGNALDLSLRRPKLILLSSTGLLCASLALIPLLGSEFMPTLDEGSIWLRLRMPASIAHKRTSEITKIVEEIIREFPETTLAVTRVGRSGMGSDIEGVDAADMYIGLLPKSKWADRNKEHLVGKMAAAVDVVPGIMYSFSQPIADMIDDLITGIKADIGIKIFGDDLQVIDRLATEIQHSVKDVRGTGDVSREPILGAPQLMIQLDRDKMARFGLHVNDVQDVIQAALAGKVVSEVIEGSKRFGILVRFKPEQRQSKEVISNISIPYDRAILPLKQVSHIGVTRGALLINREDGQRRAAVMVNIRGRDLGSWVQEAQQKIARDVRLPRGYTIVWGGQFENQKRAMDRLAIVVPMVLFIIFVLLYFTFNSIKNAALIMLNVPFATIGGIIALYLSQQPVSVPALIGFIALFGVAVQNGVLLITYISQLQKANIPLDDAIREGSLTRFRPVLMTAMVAMMGLLPKLFSDGTGAEIQRPLATVVFGGLLTATTMTLLVLPTIYKLINKNAIKQTTQGADTEQEQS